MCTLEPRVAVQEAVELDPVVTQGPVGLNNKVPSLPAVDHEGVHWSQQMQAIFSGISLLKGNMS